MSKLQNMRAMKRNILLVSFVVVSIILISAGVLYALSTTRAYRCNHDSIQAAVECLIVRYHLSDEPIHQDKFFELLRSLADEFDVNDAYINSFYFYHRINYDGTHDISISSPIFDTLIHSR